MQELITPEQSERFVSVAAIIVTLALAAYGWRAAKLRGVWLGLLGPALYAAWRIHVHVTRFDPNTGYFGLDKVNVLLLEVVFAIVLGTLVGRVWNARLNRTQATDQAE